MAYIGNKPTVGNFQICDAISVVNGQAAYTMQVGSVNVIPQSANHMIVSLNGTIQKPNSSFTVSGAVITFSSNLVTNDVIDFIQILGDVLDLGVPSDATVTSAKLASTSVTAAKLNNDIISGTTALTSEPADTDEFLVSDAGTLKRIDYSLIKPSSDFVKISTTSVSSATSSVSLTGINSTYMNYVIKASDLAQASTGTNLRFRYINASGDITTSSYYGVGDGAFKPYNSADGNVRWSLFNTDYAQLTNYNGSSNTGYTSSFEMNLPNPSNANTMPSCYGQMLTDSDNGSYLVTNIFSFKQTYANTAVTGIKFYLDGVNITQGNFTLYGIKG